MKRILLVSTFLTIFTASGTAQLNKRNWLFGGNLSYSRNKTHGSDAENIRSRFMDLRPYAGYFFANRFVGGFAFQYENTLEEYSQSDGLSSSVGSNNLIVGPFFRYYVLPSTKKINIFPEISGSYAFSKTTSTTSLLPATTSIIMRNTGLRYGAGLGAAFFVNNSVAIEVLGTYNLRNEKDLDTRINSLQFRVGLNYYLER
jgi:hypothetical protein